MKKNFRKIIIDDKEYDWCYQKYYYENSYVNIYDIYYEHHNKKNLEFKRRRFLTSFEVDEYISITPIQVRELMKTGKLITKKSARYYKLERLNKIQNVK